ncbi:ATP-binding protein [Flavitalea antarctica]
MSVSTEETIQRENLFQDVFDALPVAVTLIDRKGVVQFANNAFLEMSGWNYGEVIGKRFNTLFQAQFDFTDNELNKHDKPGYESIKHDDQGKPGKNSFPPSNDNSQKPGTCQLVLRLPGHQHPYSVQVTNVCDFYCFTFNGRDQKRPSDHASHDAESLRLALQNETLIEKLNTIVQHNRDLQRSNQDLYQYAYVASHDLQEPLRKIKIFSDILVGSGQLSGKEKFIANKIMMASERMSLLVRDLLNYSKLLKADAVFEEVDLNEIVKAVLIDFEVKIQEKNAVVHFPQMPAIQGIKLQLNQLFYNLLGNALKFTIPGQAPEVLISVREIDDVKAKQYIAKPFRETCYLHIRFADNGIGFEQEQSEQIFEVFSRLYPREVYEGSGIGLALCRRIVQNHRGCLFATSAPGKGSSFDIIIPTRHPPGAGKKKGQNEDSAPL